ncbi:MAG: PLP-dependent cysteine synthase family protein [Candidatus Thorarchaeota archaeon]
MAKVVSSQIEDATNSISKIQDNSLFFKKFSILEKHSLISLIGNTPLIPIQTDHFNINSEVKIFAKAEWLNPGGSVKDRPAWFMVRNAIRSGEIFDEYGQLKYLVDASSGNTAIGYGLVSSILGLKLKLFMPKNASIERIKTLKAYGVELVLTDPSEGIDGAINAVRTYSKNYPDCLYLDQYNNDWNWKAHYYTTGKEIIKQTFNKVTHFISTLGTSGTFMGVGKRLREELSNKVKLIAIQPDSPFHGIEGLKHMESSITPGIYDKNFPDQIQLCSTKEAEKYARILSKQGIFVGTSSGASMAVSLKIAEEIESGIIVTIFPDRGERYLSTHLWD